MLTITPKIALNDTAEQWDLYTSHPEAPQVATAINAAIEEAVNSGERRGAVERAACAVMRRNDKHGAYDTEPLDHLKHLLDRIFPETH